MQRRPDGVSVVISARLSRGQEALLVAWFLAWTCCGIAFIHGLTQPQQPGMRQLLLVMVAFWTYFELRIGRVLLWRKKGFELLRVQGATFTVKDSLFRYGKANDYFVENIQRFGPINVDETSWKWQLVDSFWTRGGERLGFEYQGRKVAFGKGLTRVEAQRVADVLARELKRVRKAAVQ
ncbi:MAG: hypothetical protein QM724_08325 [Flavobacteriales bacterium]